MTVLVPMEFFGVGGGEFALLLILAVIMFGPEKLPELSRKAARVVYAIRGFADQATGQLRAELGPEYKDLKLSDLNPKTLVRKTLLADIEGDLNEIKAELNEVKSDLAGSAADVQAANSELTALVSASVKQPVDDQLPPGPQVAWDLEAT